MSKKLKVVQVLYSGLGGHGSVFFSLVEGSAEHNVENAAIFYGIEDLKPEYSQFCQTHGLPHFFIRKKPGIDSKSWRGVYRALDTIKPDVVVLHSLNLLMVALAYRFKRSCTVIVVEHTPLKAKTKAEWLFSGLAMVLAPKIVLLTRQYAQQLKTRLGSLYREEKITIINNGLNLDKFVPPLTKKAKPEILVSMVGRFSETKDQQTLVKAFKQVVEQNYLPAPVKLHLAGSGDQLNRIRDLVNASGLTEQVVFTGLLSENQIVDFLQQTDIYVHASLSETMCTSVMQAMAVGLPVVGTDIEGINNLINLPETGLLYPSKDAEALAQAILFLVKNHEERSEMAANARAYAVKELSHKVMFQKYYQLFK